MTRKVVSVDNMVHKVLIVQVFVKWNNHHLKFHQRGSVARSVHQVLYPLLCFLDSFYVFLLHLIFTLLELSSSYCDDMTMNFVLLGLKTKFVSFHHTSTAFRSVSISFEYLLFFILQLR